MLPYPGIPYGVAPAWCFPAAEVCVLVLFICCAVHAIRTSKRDFLYLFGGLLFGLLLEYFEVVTGSYTYGRFRAMVGTAPHDVPLWIGAGWGVIMYTARLFSDALQLPFTAAAALDTLLALNIDLSMDVVAYRTHMWHWPWSDTSRALTSQWFGIPYGNFVGWATVVFCYSLFSRTFERRLSRRGSFKGFQALLVAILAIASALACLVGSEELLFPPMAKYLGMTSGWRLLLIAFALFALVVAGWPKRHGSAALLPSVALWVPTWFHVFFSGCFLFLGFYRENSWMNAAALANLAIGLAIHVYPYRVRARVRAANVRAERTRAAGMS